MKHQKFKKIILFITPSLLSGGVETMMYSLILFLSQEGFDCRVLCLTNKGFWGANLERIGVPVMTLNMTPGQWDSNSLIKLLQIVRQIKPNLIQGKMYHGNLAAQLAGMLSFQKKSILWSIHSSLYSMSDEKKTTQRIIGAGARLSVLPKRIIYVSHASRLHHEKIGYCPAKGVVIPNGIDCSVFKPDSEAKESLSRELGIPRNSFLIGLVARFHPQKDHVNYLKAASCVLAMHPKTYFLLAGRGLDINNAELLTTIRQLRLESHVMLLGERKDIPRLNAAFDIATLSSSYGEAFPNVIGEAMACGIPCVVTDVGDSALIVGDTGIVVPPRDFNALATAYHELIEIGSSGRKKMGEIARQRIAETYSLERIVAQYKDLYEKMM